MKKVVASLIILALTFLTIAAVLIATGHAETTKPRPNTLGVLQEVTNPWTYIMGLPIDGQVLEGKYTNVRIVPYAAPGLFDESILFCGDVSEAFRHAGVVVVTYRTQASRLYRGVACHTLLDIHEVSTK